MARVVQNDKGFKVIALSHEEGEKIGWGLWTRSEDNTEDECHFLCMHCNHDIKGELYYIAVLNDVMDKECYEAVATAGDDCSRIQASEWIQYPKRGFALAPQIMETRRRIGGGGIFTRQCLEWCKAKFGDKEFDRIIIFSDSQDCDYPDKRIPKPFGTYNYICDVSAHTKGVNYKGVWTAEISGMSEHFLTYIAALEGLENKFEEE